MALVYLIRHGQASFGAADYDVLSATGQLQGKVIGAELRRRGLQPDQVWSGTLRRQRETVTAAGFDSVRTDPRWNEYDHLGLVGAEAQTTPREFQLALDTALRQWIGGPDWRTFSDDVTSALRDLLADLGSGSSAVVFTSGGVIAAACATLLGLPAEGFLALNRVAVNAAFTKIVSGRSGTSLVSYNDHAHFEGEHRELLTYR
jgi:broad specificity phosphatase PhoE